jgi:autotransporter-associated beta strand protein
MLVRRILLSVLVAATLGTCGGSFVDAATYYWSSAGTAGGATGLWDTVDPYAYWATSSTGPYSSLWPDTTPGNAAYFQGTAGTVTISGATPLRAVSALTTSVNGYCITGGTLNLDNGASAGTLSATTGTTTIASVIGGAYGLTKTGAGVLNLTGVNTYSGPTTMVSNGGFLVIKSSQALGNSSGFVMQAGSTSTTSGALILSGNGIVLNMPMTLSGYQNGYYTDEIGQNLPGTVGNEGGSNTISGAITSYQARSYPRSGSTLTFTGPWSQIGDSYFGGNGDVVLAGNITGGATTRMRYQGNVGTQGSLPLGTLYFTGDNSGFAGSISFFGAAGPTVQRINLQNADAVGAGGIFENNIATGGQTIQLQGAAGGGINFTNRPMALCGSGGTASLGGSPVNNGALENIAGNNTWNGPITLLGPSQINCNADSLTLSGGITSGTDSFGLTFGAGNVTLSAANSHLGPTTVAAGTLRLMHQNALQNSTFSGGAGSLVFDSSAVGGSFTFGGLSGSSNLALQDNATPTPGAIALTVGGNSAGTTYSGALSGPGSLTKLGAGVLTLSGPNSYRGPTAVGMGTLQLANPGALSGFGTSSANVSVAYGATLAVNAGGTGEWTEADLNSLVTATCGTVALGSGSTLAVDTTNAVGGRFVYGRPIAGDVGLTKLGANSLVLSGTNTYTGATNISAGALGFANTATMAAFTNPLALVNVAAGATLAVNAGGASDWSGADISTLLGLYNVTFNTGSMLGIDTTNATGPVSLSNPIGGLAGLNKLGAGTLVLGSGNTYVGPTGVAAGTLTYGAASPLVYSSGLIVSGGLLDMAGYTDTVQGVTLSGGLIAGGTLSSNTAFALQAGTVSAVLAGSSGLTKTTAGAVYLSGVNTYSGSTTVSAGTLQVAPGGALGSGNVTVNGASALLDLGSYTGSVGAVAITGGSITSAGSVTSSGAVAISGGGILTVSGSANFTTAGSVTLTNGIIAGAGTVTSNAGFSVGSGTISASLAGNVPLTKVAGTATISGANSYSGLTTISGGNNAILVIKSSQALGNSSGVVWSGGAASNTNGALILSGNGLVISQPMTLQGFQSGYYADEAINPYVGTVGNEGGSNTISGAIVCNTNARSFPRSGSTLTFNGSWNHNGAAMTYWGGNGSIVFAGNITGTGGTASGLLFQANVGAVTTLPYGTIYFTGDNSGYNGVIGWYGGSTTGTATSVTRINLQNANAVPLGGVITSSYVGNNQCLQLQYTGGVPGGGLEFANRGNITLYGVGGTLSVGGSPTNLGALENVAGNNTWTGPITLGAATRINSDQDTLTLSGNLTNGAYLLTLGGAGNLLIAGAISPAATAGGLTKDGTGTVTLAGPNAYAGSTTVSLGVLDLVDSTPAWTGAFAPVLAHGANIQSPSAKLLLDYAVGYDPLATIAPLLNVSIRASGAGMNPLVALDNGTGRITIESTLLGDADLNGTVNGADLNAVLSNYNQVGFSGLAGWRAGDFDGSGTVNGADLNTVLSNYNQGVSVGAAVPEPSTLLLAVAGLIALLAHGWRRR